MNISEIFRSVVENQTNGLMFHAQMISYFDFLGLNGFADVQKCRFESESREMVETRRYFVEAYGAVSVVGGVSAENDVVPSAWTEIGERLRLSGEQCRSAVKFAIERWCDWEERSLKIYEENKYFADELRCGGASVFIDGIIDDTQRELRYVNMVLGKLRCMDFDAYSVVLMQNGAVKEYRKFMNDRKENGDKNER